MAVPAARKHPSYVSHSLPGFRAVKVEVSAARILIRTSAIHFRASRLSGHFGEKFLYYVASSPIMSWILGLSPGWAGVRVGRVV